MKEWVSVKKTGTLAGILVVMAIIIFGVIYGGITLTKNWGKSKDTISEENAVDKLNKIYKDIDVNKIEPRKAHIDLGVQDVKDTIPDNKYLQIDIVMTSDGPSLKDISTSPNYQEFQLLSLLNHQKLIKDIFN